MSISQESLQSAISLLNSKDSGILSTISLKLDGFPFGSVVPYCLNEKGQPVVLISTIAEHTKNISSDNRCSITIVSGEHDVQANGRLCIIGNMEKVDSDDTLIQERYYRHFPNSKTYGNTHNFSFYYLKPISYRYIGGFGAIYWIEPTDFSIDNPFHGTSEDRIVNHMNEDHLKDLTSYCTHFKQMVLSEEDVIRMVGIDPLGFDVFVNDRKIRFDFKEAISNATEARERLVELSKQSK